MPKKTHFLSWDRPLPDQGAAWLAIGRTGKPIDLSDTWVIVPTRQAGRRLREAIARNAHAAGTAALAPRVTLPEAVFDYTGVANRALLASRAATHLHWARTLLDARLQDLPDVFPHSAGQQNERRGFPWALGLGTRLAALRKALAEGGLRIADVASRAGPSFPETDRWTQLAGLESAYLRRIRDAGLADPDEVKLDVARGAFDPPAGFKRIVLMGCPDPMPLVLNVLEAWSATIDVEVVIPGPSAGEEKFDAWGRPLPSHWPANAPELPDFENRVHLCADPDEQADRIAAWAGCYEHPDTLLAVGCADETVVPCVAAALSKRGIACFNPEGSPVGRSGLAHLVGLLRRFLEDGSYETAGEIARRPEILGWMEARLGGAFGVARFLAGMDELSARHLPASLRSAMDHSPGLESSFSGLGAGLKLIAELETTAREVTFPDGFLGMLQEIIGEASVDFADPAGRRRFAEVEALRSAVDEVAAAGGGSEINSSEGWELTLAVLAGARVYGEKPAGAVEILGWLELLWEDAPHIVVSGMNEGRVPESVTSDAFLPGSLREQLGLRSNEDRLARDSYVLSALAAGRGSGGRLDVLFAKRSAAGDPMRPSRLLLACPDEQLPARVRFLFKSPPPVSGTIPWARAWPVEIPKLAPVEAISVTAFRDYLACPFRFCLKHVLKMRAVEPGKRELDARDFGSLVHVVLERLGRDDAWRDCTDGELLARLFSAELDKLVAGRFGKSLSIPLVVQIESARQRLQQAAHVQAATRAEGWRIEEAEWAFPADAVALEGIRVRGKIDRVERHEETGAVRVLDYKTSDKRSMPGHAHQGKLGRGKSLRFDFAGCEVGGAPGAWIDLQLPLYRLAAARFGDEIECGYFNLPKAVSETAIEVWQELDPAMQAGAVACATGVAANVRAGVFWPPNEDIDEDRDDFARLFHEGVASSVAEPTRPGRGDR